ncbi:MAG TPA: cation:proton antiporter [Pyrinomonadaceae bacterium]|nr:cation:proton antiporter [Pyrinomonadaceae bacterium]
MSLIVIFLTLLFVHGLVSSRLERTIFTAPIIFTGVGILAFFVQPIIRDGDGGQHYLLTVAELGLVLLLFADAYKTDLAVLNSFRRLPVRLLTIGMLLTILLGLLSAVGIFPNLSIWEAGILAAILAPTDAGLGQIIVQSPKVPLKIRQSLNVEAGLNDGLSVPFLLFFIAIASGGGEGHSLSKYIVEQLGYGTLIGVVIGFVGGRLLGQAERRETTGHMWAQLSLLALPLLCLLASEASGASMFIAAFVGGMAARFGARVASDGPAEFTEHAGQLFNLSVFFLFGLMVARDWHQFNAWHFVYAVFSLTLIRMLPVAIALMGTKLSQSTILFMGWFGPRGLASIVLGLVFLEHATQQPGAVTIRMAVMATVLLSIFAHGFSALPGIAAYQKSVEKMPMNSSEFAAVETKVVEQPA